MPTAAREPPGNCWPSRRHVLLLQACVWTGPPALDAWRRWRTDADLNTLDLASRRLLPLAYQRLRAELQDDADRARLKGLLRATWFRNELMLRRAADVLGLFSTHGIRAVVLKGAALAIRSPAYGAARPMDDIDLLVGRDQVAAALRLLIDCGWTAGLPLSPRRGANRLRMVIAASEDPSEPRHGSSSDALAVFPAVGLRASDGVELDLHWRLNDLITFPEDLVWHTVRPLTWRGSDAAVPSDALMLVHVLVHGIRWSPLAPVRWVADAATIIALAGRDFDWDAVIALTREGELVPWVRDGLTFLRTELMLPVPGAVIHSFEAEPVSRAVRAIYDCVVLSPGFLSDVPLQWRLLQRLGPARSRIGLLGDLILHFRLRWGVRRIWQWPFRDAARALSRRLTGVLLRPGDWPRTPARQRP